LAILLAIALRAATALKAEQQLRQLGDIRRDPPRLSISSFCCLFLAAAAGGAGRITRAHSMALGELYHLSTVDSE
jgi:hypothetical protein